VTAKPFLSVASSATDGHDAEVEIAAVAIELAQLLAVVLDPVGVVVVVAGQELVPVRLLGDDDVLQVVVRVFGVAQEVDAQHAALGAFVDLEHQVDALLRQFDHLGRHGRRDAARTAIEFDDALDVGLNLGAGEDAARTDLHLVLQLVFLERRVPLEDHLVDDRVLDDLDDQVAALQLDLHVGEQIGAGQGLQRQVEALRVDRLARLDRQVGQHGPLLDPLVALHHDALDHARALGLGERGLRRGQRRGTEEKRNAGGERGAMGANFVHGTNHGRTAQRRTFTRTGRQ
jgi:hypothetical protein